MKKITLLLFVVFAGLTASAQTYSTGMVTFFSDYSGKIDVTSTTVTLTLVGPSTSWLGVGFNAASMDDLGMDAVIFDGTNMTDRTLSGVGVIPPLDATQNWTVNSNTINLGVRTVVATRARSTGDSNDYIFPFSAQPINIIFARRPGSTAIGYHGSGNCSATTVDLVLGIASFDMEKIKIYPIPAKNFINVELPEFLSEANISIYDLNGKEVLKAKVTAENPRVETSAISSGSYLMTVKTSEGEGSKKIVIQ